MEGGNNTKATYKQSESIVSKELRDVHVARMCYYADQAMNVTADTKDVL